MDLSPLYRIIFYFLQGFFSPLKVNEIPDDKVDIWVHCSSLGEIMAAKPIVDCFINRKIKVLMTVFTSSGFNKAQELWEGKVRILRFPLDSYFHIKKIIEKTEPRVFVNLETELWPNLLTLVRRNEITAFLVNGRVSERNFKKSRLIRGTYKKLLGSFEKIYAQTEEDKRRFLALGAKEEQIIVTGNIKIDSIEQHFEGFTREDLKIKDDEFVILFGSLREKEEKQAIRVIRNLLCRFSSMKVFVAPRHLNRVESIASSFSSMNIEFTRWSEGSLASKGVVIIDVLGKLRNLYNVANLVVMGGTFAPYGGHNIMEPVSAGKAVIVGPFYGNIKKEVEELKERNAVFVLKTSEELLNKIIELMEKPDLLKQVGESAKKWLFSKQGISKQICEEILLHLKKSSGG